EHSNHEEGELRCRFGQHICRVSEWDFVTISVNSIDVVEADRNLGDNFKSPLPCFENLRIDRIAQGCDQAIDSALHLFDNQFLRRRLRTLKNLELITALAQEIFRGGSDARSGEDTKSFLIHHDRRRIERMLTGFHSAIGYASPASDPQSEIHRFFFAQESTRSSAFSMFSIELATLNRK